MGREEGPGGSQSSARPFDPVAYNARITSSPSSTSTE